MTSVYFTDQTSNMYLLKSFRNFSFQTTHTFMDNFLKHFALALRYLLENQGKGKFRMFYFQHSISSRINCKRLDIAPHSHVFEMVIKVIVHYPHKQH